MSDLRPSDTPANPIRGVTKPVFASLILSVAAVTLSVIALLVAVGSIGRSAASPDFERQARAYITNNPEIIVEALKRMEARKEASEADELTAVLSEGHDEIFNDPTSPVGGNPKGDVTLVEFFDYNCPYCRRAAPMLHEIERADLNLRIVFKEFPILGPGSKFASRAAPAAQKQGKFLAFHDAIMAYKGGITEDSALEIAADAGLDVEQLKKEMDHPAPAQAIERNHALAEALRISATPSFVIGKEVVRGLIDLDTIKQLIADARRG